MLPPETLRAAVSAGARALAGHLGLALLASMPMALSPATRLLGHPEVDVWNHAWGPWWFWTSLSQGHLPLQTTLLGAPLGGRLWFPDGLGALVGAPLVPLLGPVVAWNAVVLFHLVLASVGGRRLARALGAEDRESWLGAALLCCSPYLLSEAHNGISEAMAVGPPVLALAATVTAMQSGRARSWVLAGAWGGLTLAGTAYFSIGLLAVAAPLLLGGLVRHGARRVLPGAALALLIAAAIGLPALRAAWWTLQADPLVFRPPTRTLADLEPQLRHNAVDPRTFLWPGDFQSVLLDGESFRHSSYLGLLALLLALRSRAWLALVAALLGLVLSLGPWLWFDGDWLLWQGQRLALPYKALFEVLPPSTAGHPQRVGLPAIALVAALAARGLRGLSPRVAASLAGLALAEVLLLSPSPWPLARTPVIDPAPALAVRAATQAAGGGLVLDLPADVPGRGMVTSRHLFAQTLHGQPLPYKPDVRANTSSLGGIAALRWLASGEGDPPWDGGQELAQAGVAVVVVHRDLLAEEDARRVEDALRQWLGSPQEVGTAAVFRRPAPATGAPRWSPGLQSPR
ncbi:hypothetical protein L6R53_07435 [Myxococcota bacterium]|nr:hypothetical protein [Myxococcota bacterium]